MRLLTLLLLVLTSLSAYSACPIAEKTAREKGLKASLLSYYHCALAQNDDDSQLYLAQLYEIGKGDVPKNIQKSLLFYQLSSENGNATAMVGLARLITKLDSDPTSRIELASFMKKVADITTQTRHSSFSGQVLHPYALLVLAAEKPESKWFYTTRVKTNPQAAQLLRDYTIDTGLQKSAIREATAWKQRKMDAVAYQVLSADEYRHFADTLYPKNNLPDRYARSRAVSLLKERIESQP